MCSASAVSASPTNHQSTTREGSPTTTQSKLDKNALKKLMSFLIIINFVFFIGKC